MKPTLVIVFLAGLSGPSLPAQPVPAEMKEWWDQIGANLIKSAEKMPEAGYAFRPAATVRSFGQLIGHLADANTAICSAVYAEKKPAPGAEAKLSSKTDLVQALQASVAYCSSVAAQLSDTQLTEKVPLFGRQRSRLSVLHLAIAHANEHYGNLVTYLRMKDLVPPSSEGRMQSSGSIPLYYDRAHGTEPPAEKLMAASSKLSLSVRAAMSPITPEALRDVRILYLRAPSKAFQDEEITAIVDFVKRGRSLLLVLDEERRQSLVETRVNRLIEPFGMKLTADTPYLHNCGAIAKAGEVVKGDRELPFSGGRAVEGGTPFAYQLDAKGNPAQPFAAWKRIAGGGKIVVMAEGMASMFLGTPEGQRLTGVDRDPTQTTYWGKDATIFMEEVLSWLK